jgi:hypothetical protein
MSRGRILRDYRLARGGAVIVTLLELSCRRPTIMCAISAIWDMLPLVLIFLKGGIGMRFDFASRTRAAIS